MANATALGQIRCSPWDAEFTKRNCKIQAVTFYPATMVGLDANGQAVKCDDTSGIRFDGIMADSRPITVASTDTLGDKILNVQQPRLFTVKIASAAVTDVGRKVYALYDNEVSFTGSNSVLVGVVHRYIDATHLEIRPYWLSVSGVVGFDGETLTFDGSTGGNTIVIPDNLADGLSFVEGANPYLTFNTTDTTGEYMLASKPLSFLDSMGVKLGTGQDIVIAWDGTRLNVTQAAPNSEIRWGVDAAGIDQIWYGDTASTTMSWDQSADSLIFTGAVKMLWTGTTGQPEMHLTDNLADALSVKIPSGNDLLFFTTTNSAEKVTIPAAFVQGSNATDRVVIQGIYMSPSNVVVAVPTIADTKCDVVAVDVSGAFAMAPAVGDAVIAIPQEAMPTDCLIFGAYVTATDEISVTFGTKEGGSGVTGANKNFKFLVIDLT